MNILNKYSNDYLTMSLRLCLCLIFLLSGLNCKEASDPDLVEKKVSNELNIQPVKIKRLELSQKPISIKRSGLISSSKEIPLSFLGGGTIEQLFCKEGERVSEGQVLGQLQSMEYDAHITKAQKLLEKYERDLERVNNLYRDTLSSLESVENLLTKKEMAEADLSIALFRKQQTRLVAPTNGRIIKRNNEPNEIIAPGVPVFTMTSSDNRVPIIKLAVADKEITQLKIGDKAKVSIDAYPNEKFNATLTNILEKTNSNSSFFEIELTIIPRKGFQLLDGFMTKVDLYPSTQTAFYPIDIEAIVEGYKDKVNIFVPVDSSKAHKVSVTPLFIGDDFVAISKSDLASYSHVIISGVGYLRDGQAIEIISSK